MKKFLTVLVSIVFAVCLCLPLAACGDNGQIQETSKRIIGIDSEKIYLKAKIHLLNELDIIGKNFVFEIYSYDKIEKSELQAVNFEIDTKSKYDLIAEEFDLVERDYNDREGYYRYYIKIRTFMRFSSDETRIKAVVLKVSGKDYKFKTDIDCIMDTYRPVFVKPQTYGFNMLNAGKSVPYGLLISTAYDMTLKSIKFQTEGFEILSYEVETYTAPQTGTSEFITDKFPVTLEANKGYQINIEAIPPQDCLYYGYDLEVVVETGGIEMIYNNIETISGGDFYFMGSALNALTA